MGCVLYYRFYGSWRSTILLPTKVRFLLQVWRLIFINTTACITSLVPRNTIDKVELIKTYSACNAWFSVLPEYIQYNTYWAICLALALQKSRHRLGTVMRLAAKSRHKKEFKIKLLFYYTNSIIDKNSSMMTPERSTYQDYHIYDILLFIWQNVGFNVSRVRIVGGWRSILTSLIYWEHVKFSPRVACCLITASDFNDIIFLSLSDIIL